MEAAKTAEGAAEPSALGDSTWAIVEVFGHRRLAGRVREVSIAGTKMLRVDIPGNGGRCRICFGAGKPQHSDRACRDCAGTGKAKLDEGDFVASQLYGGSAIFSITPVTEDAARAVALRSQECAPPTIAALPALPAAPVVDPPEESKDGARRAIGWECKDGRCNQRDCERCMPF